MIGLAISRATDWLDGYVSRKMKIDYVVGSYLDPLADKNQPLDSIFLDDYLSSINGACTYWLCCNFNGTSRSIAS
ncbi:hypothetical protein K1719_034823 [Acacia pycnantha]|nr:hypothetical protein K1719_034823 [Acacia pycnantha]